MSQRPQRTPSAPDPPRLDRPQTTGLPNYDKQNSNYSVLLAQFIRLLKLLHTDLLPNSRIYVGLQYINYRLY